MKSEYIAYSWEDRYGEGLTELQCAQARWNEYATIPQLDTNPAMSARQFELYRKKHAALFRQLRIQNMRILVWEALEDLLRRNDSKAASGRVFLYRDRG